MDAIGEIAPGLTLRPETLGEQILECRFEDGYGAFDRAIKALAPALGPRGCPVICFF